MRTWLRFTLYVGCAALLLACGDPPGDASVTGSIQYGNCGEVLPWEPVQQIWSEQLSDDAVIRFHSRLDTTRVANDSLVFVIDDRQALFDNPTVPIDVGDREYERTRASANLTLAAMCPDDRGLSVYLHGVLQLTELSREEDGPVRGYFEGRAVDQRTGATIGEHVRLDFDFNRDKKAWRQSFSQTWNPETTPTLPHNFK